MNGRRRKVCLIWVARRCVIVVYARERVDDLVKESVPGRKEIHSTLRHRRVRGRTCVPLHFGGRKTLGTN